MQRLDSNVYKSEQEKKEKAMQAARRFGSQIIGFGSLEEVYVA